jgi:protein-S-isoprenylcysteine O-methyltransferase Ste14
MKSVHNSFEFDKENVQNEEIAFRQVNIRHHHRLVDAFNSLLSHLARPVRIVQSKTIYPPTYFGIAFVIMVALHLLFPGMRIGTFPWNLLGIVPVMCGIALNLFASNAFGKLNTTIKPFEISNTLVTDGLFRISRNPMYLGFVLILIGAAAVMGSLTPYLVIPVFAILLQRIFIAVEERMLEKKFGQSWLAYKEKVRRWI